MEKQDFLNRLAEIGTCDDDVQRRELLSQLGEEASKDYDNITTLTESNEALTNANETLREANMKMFLRMGADKTPDEESKDKTGVGGKEKEKRNFNDLFNEKGDLK